MSDVEFPVTEFIQNIPDIFIYLTNKDDEHVSFDRKPYEYYATPTQKSRYVNLIPDKAVANLRQDQCGILKIRGNAYKGDPPYQQNSFIQNVNSQIQSKYSTKRIVCNVFQCQNLVPSSLFGDCNPLLKISFMGINVNFPLKNKTLNPVWYRSMEMSVPYFNDSDEQPPILVRLFDHQEYNFTDDYLGSCIIDIKQGLQDEYIKDSREKPIPTWFDIYYNKNTTAGKILLSFNIIPEDRTPLQQLRIMPQLETYQIQIKIFGLRNLISSGIMSVKRPFIKINRNHLIQIQKYLVGQPPPKETTPVSTPTKRKQIFIPSPSPSKPNSLNTTKETVKQIKANHDYIDQEEFIVESRQSGENPCINQIVMFNQELPKNLELIPTLSCTVHDKIFYGLYQPLIGQFTIDLQKYILKNEKILKKRIEKSQRFLEEMSAIQQSEQGSIKINIPDFKIDNVLEESANVKKKKSIKHMQSIKLKTAYQQGVAYNEKLLQDINPRRPDIKINTDYTLFWARYESSKDKNNQIKEISPIPIKEYFVPLSYDGINSKLQYIKNSKYKTNDYEEIELENEDVQFYNFEKTYNIKFAHYKGVRKHYRYFVNEKLEDTRFVRQDGDQRIIDDIDIIFQRRYTESDKYSELNLTEKNTIKAGTFKGIINVTKLSDIDQISVLYQKKQDMIEKEFLTLKNVLVRVYILEASNLPKTDIIGYCDPYLVVKLGDQVIENKKRYKTAEANPKFYEMFQFKSTLPGHPVLKIQLMDFDKFTSDDFMCETSIDLEERFYSNRWRKIKNPPIEVRPLYHPSSSLARGDLKLWLEIIPENDIQRISTIYHIIPKPSEEFEIRCVIWSAHNIPQRKDKQQSDLFIRAIFGSEIQTTDVHKKSQMTASFNWRFKFPITLPSKDTVITFQALDEDIFSLDGYLCSGVLNFSKEAVRAHENDKSEKIYGEQLNIKQNILSLFNNQSNSKEKFEIRMKSSSDTVSNEDKIPYLLATFEILPKSQAIEQHVGVGRSEPNHSPFCPEPQGRIEWSWNPIKLYYQTVAPIWRKKLFYLFIMFLCIEIFVLIIPAYVGSYLGTSSFIGSNID